MHGQPASPARHNYRFTIGEKECAEHHPARPELRPERQCAASGMPTLVAEDSELRTAATAGLPKRALRRGREHRHG